MRKLRKQAFLSFVAFAFFAVIYFSVARIRYRGKINNSEAIMMRFKIAAMMCLIFAAAVSLMAQTKTVTNADLEKYRQVRLKAEREYRENYERLGLASPAELERRNEQSRADTQRLADKLRDAELERERLNASVEANSRSYFPVFQTPTQPRTYSPSYFLSYGRHYRLRQPYYLQGQTGYVGGGQFWPTGGRTPLQPTFKRPPARGK